MSSRRRYHLPRDRDLSDYSVNEIVKYMLIQEALCDQLGEETDIVAYTEKLNNSDEELANFERKWKAAYDKIVVIRRADLILREIFGWGISDVIRVSKQNKTLPDRPKNMADLYNRYKKGGETKKDPGFPVSDLINYVDSRLKEERRDYNRALSKIRKLVLEFESKNFPVGGLPISVRKAIAIVFEAADRGEIELDPWHRKGGGSRSH